KKFFSDKELQKMGVMDEKLRVAYQSSFNTLANLQLIQESENLEKNATPFKEWLEAAYADDQLLNYKNLHNIPLDNDLTMNTFMEFYQKRRNTLKHKLMQLLDVKSLDAEVVKNSELVEEETID